MDDENEVLLTYSVHGSGELLVPEPAAPARTDGLWSTTCFECFLQPVGSERYQEYNFSPSGRWAAYAFEGYRQGVCELALAVEPHVGEDLEVPPSSRAWDVDLDLTQVPPGRVRLGLSAVIEEANGAKSYWALRHPPGPPDFHHPDCFALELPPLDTA